MELDGKCNRVLLLVGIMVFQWYLTLCLRIPPSVCPKQGQLLLLSPVAHLVHIEAQSAIGHLSHNTCIILLSELMI